MVALGNEGFCMLTIPCVKVPLEAPFMFLSQTMRTACVGEWVGFYFFNTFMVYIHFINVLLQIKVSWNI